MKQKSTYGARIAYLVMAWLMVAGVGFVVFVAGLGLFSSRSYWELHMTVGHSLEAVILLLALFAVLGWIPRANVRLMLILFADLVIQVVLAVLRDSVPVLAALHPVNALVLAGLSVVHARAAIGMVRATRRATTPTDVRRVMPKQEMLAD